MRLTKFEPDSGSAAGVAASDSGTEGGNIKVEESDTEVEVANIKVEELIDVKEETPEPIKSPPIKTEPEVSVWGLCVRQQQFMFPRPFTATKREHGKINFICLYICISPFVQFII
jgi:hypothetical protein